MSFLYFLGIDIAGAENSWVCELIWDENKLFWQKPPYQIKALGEILEIVRNKDFICCAIDAPLSFSLQAQKWRLSDIALRCFLRREEKNWVQSPNSMQAVPLRGQQLASLIKPYIGTIIETHPRSSLAFMLNERSELLKTYKTSSKALQRLRKEVFNALPSLLDISLKIPQAGIKTDGGLDAFICALIAFLYIKDYNQIYKLPLEKDLRGFAPFYVFRPTFAPKMVKQVKYTPGNWGDVLKHSWLIAITKWLLKQTPFFRYADTFCGFPLYQTEPKVVWRFEEILRHLPLYKVQRPYLQNCQYVGSSYLVKLLCESKRKQYLIDFYDKNLQAVRAYETLFQKSPLPLKDGYEILTLDKDYDLILLDPYIDFWGNWKRIIPLIFQKQANSSLLLFTSYKPEEKYHSNLWLFLKENRAKYIAGELNSSISLQEEGYLFSIFFFPQNILQKVAQKELIRDLDLQGYAKLTICL